MAGWCGRTGAGRDRGLPRLRKRAVMRTPIHPGIVLGEELEERGISCSALARALEVPPNRITQIVAGEREVTADTALRLARYFETSPEFWMNLQKTYELDLARRLHGKEIARIKPHDAVACT